MLMSIKNFTVCTIKAQFSFIPCIYTIMQDRPRIKGIGVLHSTGKDLVRRRFERSGKIRYRLVPVIDKRYYGNVKGLMEYLKRTRDQFHTGSPRKVFQVGVEGAGFTEEELSRKSSKRYSQRWRYFMAAHHSARKENIELIPLESDPVDACLRDFHSVILNTYGKGSWSKIKWEKIKSRKKMVGSGNIPIRSNPKVILRMVEEVERYLGDLNNKKIVALDNAITVARSLRMYENAEKEDLTHFFVGSHHIEDLEELDKIEAIYINPNLHKITLGEKQSLLDSRLLSYKILKDFIEHLRNVAKEELKSTD